MWEIIRKVLITVLLAGPIVTAGTLYFGAVYDGHLPPPDVQAVLNRIPPFATGALQTVIALVVTAIVACAAIAPIIYAARSRDGLTFLISLVLTTTAIGMFFLAKSAIQEILAVLIYLANTVLSAIVYAAYRISRDAVFRRTEPSL